LENRTCFRGASVILTGASSGIGRAMAFLLAAEGARLTLASRDGGRLEAVAARCSELGGTALAVPTDVALPDSCEALVRRAVEAHGGVDMLINNAGVSMWARFEEITDLGLFDRLIRVNYLGSVYCTHFALPHLKRPGGRIVAVSSLTGKTGVPTRSGYAASKHAMAGFFDSIRIELKPLGISVTVAYPGFVATEVRERALGPDGRPIRTSPVQEDKVMSAEACAGKILRAAALRRRETVMTPRGKLGLWMKLIAPSLVDRTASRAISRGR
jgi:NAD(P)-dependent dehydrogenase (short-subunit alcohol dehydrogenase family)